MARRSKPIRLTGTVVAKPELAYTESEGTPYAKFRLAVDRGRRIDGQWVKEGTEFWRVTAWRQLAENAAVSLDKGQLITVEGGHLEPESFTRDDGSKGVSDKDISASNVSVSLRFATVEVTRNAREATQDTGRQSPGLSLVE